MLYAVVVKLMYKKYAIEYKAVSRFVNRGNGRTLLLVFSCFWRINAPLQVPKFNKSPGQCVYQ